MKNNLEISRYKKNVEYFADTKGCDEVPNTGPEHGRIVMQNILRTAENYVHIFAGNLNGDLSNGEYLTELERCLAPVAPKRKFFQRLKPSKIFYGKGLGVKVILVNGSSPDSRAVELIKKYRAIYPQRIKIGTTTARSLQHLEFEETRFLNEPFHFTVADTRMYRIEMDIKNYFAKVCFNDFIKGMKLESAFGCMDFVDLPD